MSIDNRYPDEYNLEIRDVVDDDAGVYVCRIDSQPMQMYEVQLNVQRK